MANRNCVDALEGRAPSAPVLRMRELQRFCASLNARELCRPITLGSDNLDCIDELAGRVKLAKGDMLYGIGDPFSSLYLVRVGSLKTTVLGDDGRAQVCGYQMLGDIVGVDGIAVHRHCCPAIALEYTEVCLLPSEHLEHASCAVISLPVNLCQFLAGELASSNRLASVDALHAQQRLAGFLLDLAERHRIRGYSSSEFVLRLSRTEIASYLDLRLETVSRLFTRFNRERLLRVDGRSVFLLDSDALARRAGRRAQAKDAA